MSQCCTIAFQQDALTIAANKKNFLLSSLMSTSELALNVQKNNLRRERTVAILPTTDYQLLRTKKPLVPDAEMSTAILLQEQSKLSLPIDQLVVDYVDCPVLDGEKRIYVVAVAKRVIKDYYQKLLHASLQPIKITVPEFIYGHYIQRYHSLEKTVVWVNCFQCGSQAFAFYEGELMATLRLPKIEQATLSAASMNALNLFYSAEVKKFSTSPLWLINGVCTIEATMLSQITGKVVEVLKAAHVEYQQRVMSAHSDTVSHAYYGVLANE